MLRKFFIVLVVLLSQAGLASNAQALAGDLAGSPYNRHIVLQTLILFWIGIIGLIVIIAMKLKEAKRIQNMDAHKDDEDAPFLD